MKAPKTLPKGDIAFLNRLLILRQMLDMPELSNWPNAPAPFTPELSEVLQFIKARLPEGAHFDECLRIKYTASDLGVIQFDKLKNTWKGTGRVGKLNKRINKIDAKKAKIQAMATNLKRSQNSCPKPQKGYE